MGFAFHSLRSFGSYHAGHFTSSSEAHLAEYRLSNHSLIEIGVARSRR